MKKLRVGVVRGGPSSEYAVSLATGGAVLQNLSKELFDTQDIFISKEGEWHVLGIPQNETDALRGIDVVFNALHGTYGENGGFQSIVERLRLPYTGPRALSGALALAKPKTRNFLERQKILMPRGHVVYRGGDIQKTAQMAFKFFAPPWVVKPVNEGSSHGVRVAYAVPELIMALEELFASRESALIEEYVRGEEVSVTLVEGKNGELYALPPVRINRDGALFTHENKCINCGHDLEIPFSKNVIDEVKTIARRAHSLLALRHYTRLDFIITPAGRVYLLEVNAAPSLGEHTPTAQALYGGNTNFSEFLEHIIDLARPLK
jgi:D-alanine-D-alanine ligase